MSGPMKPFVAFILCSLLTAHLTTAFVQPPLNQRVHSSKHIPQKTAHKEGAVAEVPTKEAKEKLLRLIPRQLFGAPATNVTLNPDTVKEIEGATSNLESHCPLGSNTIGENATILDGCWRLLYSDASEITNLVRKLPLGFKLGSVFQPIDVTRGRLENQAFVKHRFLLASAHTRVLARFELESNLSAVNRAGVQNSSGRRVNVLFEKVRFTLRRLAVLPTFGLLRKEANPRGSERQKEGNATTATAPTPSVDITFCDGDLRVSRGGDGSLFVLQRVDPNTGRASASDVGVGCGRGSFRAVCPLPALSEASSAAPLPSLPDYNAATDILPP